VFWLITEQKSQTERQLSGLRQVRLVMLVLLNTKQSLTSRIVIMMCCKVCLYLQFKITHFLNKVHGDRNDVSVIT
jgi:hypothetical protein